MSYYAPAFISQFGWNTPKDDENCAAAAGALLLDRQTEGRKRSTPPRIRALIDSPSKSGGLSLTDVQEALKRGYDENIVNPLPYEPWSAFLRQLRQGRGAIIFGDCSYKRGKAKCPGPAGELGPNHALYCQEDDAERERILTYDPADRNAQSGIQWLPYGALRQYAGLWTHQMGLVNAAYSKPTGSKSGGSTGDDAIDLQDLASNPGCLGIFTRLAGIK